VATSSTPYLNHLGGVLALLVAAGGDGVARGTAPGEGSTMTPQLLSDLAAVRRARILFSHHSVGANLLEGIGKLDADAGGERLRVVSAETAPPSGSALIHVSGGRNTDPRSKIDFFAATLRGQASLKPDVAFMKLCFVDFEPRTDVPALFGHYRTALEALKRDFPGVRFAHVAAPLMARPTDLKSRLRRLLGKEVWEDAANARRAEFNQLLARTFAADPIFDLARVESTAPDGRPTTYDLGGHSYQSLYPGYTVDGGHLNALGQRVAGEAAIHFLAGAVSGKPAAR